MGLRSRTCGEGVNDESHALGRLTPFPFSWFAFGSVALDSAAVARAQAFAALSPQRNTVRASSAHAATALSMLQKRDSISDQALDRAFLYFRTVEWVKDSR